MTKRQEKTTFGELVDRAAHRFGAKEALWYQGHRWSFSEIKEDVDQAAKGLIKLGVQPGDKVALWMPNRPEWVHFMFATAKIGAVLVPINTRLRTAALAYRAHQSDSATLISVDRPAPLDYLWMVCASSPDLAPGAPRRVRVEHVGRGAGDQGIGRGNAGEEAVDQRQPRRRSGDP